MMLILPSHSSRIMKLPLLKSAAFLSLFLAHSVIAEELFLDTFDEYSITPPAEQIPLKIGKTPPAKWWSADQDDSRSAHVVMDTNKYFQGDADNQYVRLTRTPETDAMHDLNLSSMSFSPASVGKVSFDFYARAGGLESTVGTGFLLRLMANVTEGDYDAYDGQQTSVGLYITANGTIARLADDAKGSLAPGLSFPF